jgi:hypothetical protein
MKLLCITLLLFISLFSVSQPSIEWQRCLGGSGVDVSDNVYPISDGGFLVVGTTTSLDGDVSGNHGNGDVWVIKLASNGIIEWQRCLGGSANDQTPMNAHEVSDGGFVLIGTAYSTDGEVLGNHGNSDIWVIKLTSTGSIQWQRCLGGANGEWLYYSTRQTVDGGFLITGTTGSDDGDVIGHHGSGDIWVVKIDSNGIIAWQRCLGGIGQEFGYNVQLTSDGGSIITGTTSSNDGDVSGHHGLGDIWVVKLSPSGSIEWQRCLGGSIHDGSVAETKQLGDGSFIVCATIGSNDGDVNGNHGLDDIWIVKLSSNGIIEWQRCLGGSNLEYGYYVHLIEDGSFIFTGTTASNDGDVSGNHGNGDIWAVKLSSTGYIQWQRCLGGISAETDFRRIRQTTDGGFLVSGSTSSNDGDVGGNHGSSDFWVVKLSAIGDIQWQRCFGGFYNEIFQQIQLTNDGEIVLLGETNSIDGDVSGNHGNGDIWVVKLSTESSVSNLTTPNRFIHLYPNPASVSLKFELDISDIGTNYVLSDLMGNQVMSGKVISTTTTIAMMGIASGIYFLTTSNGHCARVVKE